MGKDQNLQDLGEQLENTGLREMRKFEAVEVGVKRNSLSFKIKITLYTEGLWIGKYLYRMVFQ